ncbi:tRNA-U20a,U20b-dihydrouridine synthase [Lutibacter agarilyticus]|uniref:tRNA-dihydrouridine synthase n=1 Tax=Lutibacter agarilyticus TaxID=1109740 RepID=A0A238XKF2_9FLAO|nr:tRNA-dihydrouridine synthase family protein [Lutibacter agarilyticus]SNR58449.1 tRNA-U20a,U20b-dihydrouridine synthase [Lutibacter agarilyticus]
MDSNFSLLSSPLQGFTDFRFRNAFNTYFGGIDTFYAPYIKLNGKLDIKKAYERDILPENNKHIEVIPQIMTNDAKEFLFVANYVKQLGYKELNWNLGCPYPMVTKRGMGAGLICDFVKIEQILQEVYEKCHITISMKMRMGYENSNEILKTLPVLEQFPLKNIAIHARIGKQLYKGGVDLDAFEKCINNTTHKLYYNGDITSVTTFKELQERFPSINNWMIGRGLISDPFLPSMIKNNTLEYPTSKMQVFEDFHAEIYNQYGEALSGQHHLLLKMTSFWEYFSTTFSDSRKTFKKIKKAKSIKAYDLAVREVLAQEQG